MCIRDSFCTIYFHKGRPRPKRQRSILNRYKLHEARAERKLSLEGLIGVFSHGVDSTEGFDSAAFKRLLEFEAFVLVVIVLLHACLEAAVFAWALLLIDLHAWSVLVLSWESKDSGGELGGALSGGGEVIRSGFH
eukprot:TRINITY_DN4537_c0_g1_i2.p1 TRINITY_DN4537_c0_g1~~TRINITY_DN4537_c0_g1_i2.p1  ORF type:complete len:135 (-),score=14.01 TRINITY_DN4537_c0_g1_i2:146-550(-)